MSKQMTLNAQAKKKKYNYGTLNYRNVLGKNFTAYTFEKLAKYYIFLYYIYILVKYGLFKYTPTIK